MNVQIIQTIDKWGAGYLERGKSGSEGGLAETAGVTRYGAAVPTL